MKGKVSNLRYAFPNIAKIRSRIDNPDAELSKKLRSVIEQSIVETLNESSLTLKAKIINNVNNLNLPFKSDVYRDRAFSLVGDIFNCVFASSAVELNDLLGALDDPADEPADAPASDEPADAPASDDAVPSEATSDEDFD